MVDNSPVRIYLNKIENRITFKIKTGYYFKLLTLQTVKLIGSIKTKDQDVQNVPCLEITKVALFHCNIVNSDYQHDSKVFCTFVPNKSFGQLIESSPKTFFIFKNL